MCAVLWIFFVSLYPCYSSLWGKHMLVNIFVVISSHFRYKHLCHLFSQATNFPADKPNLAFLLFTPGSVL